MSVLAAIVLALLALAALRLAARVLRSARRRHARWTAEHLPDGSTIYSTPDYVRDDDPLVARLRSGGDAEEASGEPDELEDAA